MSKDNYHRYPNDEKVKGIDYQFYNDLLAGKYDNQINRGLSASAQDKPGAYQDVLVKA
ncbi:MAG: hypothetical protein P8186_02780 [Anaerolineae bacterium]